jgi:ribosomal protein S21
LAALSSFFLATLPGRAGRGNYLEKKEKIMPLDVKLKDGETQESLLQRFQKSIQLSGVLKELKNRRYFVSRGTAARIKAKNAARKRRKQGQF